MRRPEFKTVWKSVAEAALRNKTALAHELKRSVEGEASKRIKSVYITKLEAYDIMWQKLESYYEDVGASVQAALDDLHILKPVAGDDFRGFVELVDIVESAYSQLRELGNLNILTSMAENQPSHYLGKQSPSKYYKCAFPSHQKDNINHTMEECKEFQKLPISGKNGRYQLLKEVNPCYKCFGNHVRQNCPSKEQCNCDSGHHNKMLCKAKARSENSNQEDAKVDKKETHVVQSDSLPLYPIYQMPVSGCNKSVFCDGGVLRQLI